MIYEDGCESLTTPFDMKSNGRYGASLGGPKTHKRNILRVFKKFDFYTEDTDSTRTETF